MGVSSSLATQKTLKTSRFGYHRSRVLWRKPPLEVVQISGHWLDRAPYLKESESIHPRSWSPQKGRSRRPRGGKCSPLHYEAPFQVRTPQEPVDLAGWDV